jgi:hypothetical protein
MIAGRPVRILLAAVGLGIVGVVSLVGIVGPTIASIIECGPGCSLNLDNVPAILLLATPFVAIALAAGLLLWPATLARPAAIGSGLLVIGWIGPVARESAPALAMLVALALLSASPFLLVTPAGPGARRWARWPWIGTIVAALLLWQVDEVGSRFMQTFPPPPQLAFLGVAAVVLAAGLISGTLHRREVGEWTPDRTNSLPAPPGL